MFKVGDKVECINDGACYDTYEEWVRECAKEFVKDYKKGRFYSTDKRSAKIATGISGVVVAVHDHLQYGEELVLVLTDECDVFLIGQYGLKYAEDNESSIS